MKMLGRLVSRKDFVEVTVKRKIEKLMKNYKKKRKKRT